MRIGIDLGGTKIEAIALSPAGQEITRLRVATPRDYVASLDAIAGLVRELERVAGAQGTVGVGIPGTVVPRTGLVKNANSTWLNGQPLERDLAGRLGRPVRVMNDANCFARSDVLLRQARLCRGVALRPGVRARPRTAHGRHPVRSGDRGRRGARRCGRGSDPGPIPRSAEPGRRVAR